MIQISNSIEIARPVAQVFLYVAEVQNNPQWMPVQSVKRISEGPISRGTKFKQQFLLMGNQYELEGLITEFQPHEKIAFVYDSPVFVWRGSYLFQPAPLGARMSAKGVVTLTGPLKMMETMFAPKIRKLINDTAPNLKTILEQ